MNHTLTHARMFILRRITSEGNQSNQCLGESYHLIDSFTNPDEFNKFAHNWTGGCLDNLEKNIYAFLSFKDGSESMPLYRPSTYYIMTGNGNTFANITFK